MTAYGPYSEATLIYEPTDAYYIPVVESNSVIKIVNELYPEVYKLISAANYVTKFASESYKNTLFISESFQYQPCINAVEYCKKFTIPRMIDLMALNSSNEMILNTERGNVLIKKYKSDIYVNGKLLLKSITCSNGIIYVTD